jgi:hypothetical protein
MRDFFAAFRELVLPFGATTGARLILDGVNGRIEVYDANNDLVMYVDGTAGIMVPVPGDPTSFVQVWRDGNDPEFRVETPDGHIAITSTANEPELFFHSEFLDDTFRIFTGSNGLSFVSNDNDTASFGLHTGHGVVFATASSSSNAYEVLYDEQDGFFKLGQSSPWDTYDWEAPGLPVGWTTMAASPLGYKIFPDGMVRLRGAVTAPAGVPADATTVFTLPALYRPTQDVLVPISHYGTGTPGRCYILPTGQVQLYSAPNNLPAFDTVSFSTID